MKSKVVALIPLRGGSESIPLKNIKPLAGKPLCYWTITAAKNCPEIDEVWVSTDHPQIKQTALDFGAKVIDRPAELASDTASTESVMLHFFEHHPLDILVTLQATSPLTTPVDLSNALKLFNEHNYDSLFSGVRSKRFFWSDSAEPINYDYLHRPRRQEFAGWIMENGAFYITRSTILNVFKNRLGGKIGIYPMSDDTAIELDGPIDWITTEILLQRRQTSSLTNKIKKIKYIFSDFDGVFTDNTVFTNQNEIETVQTSKEDSLGLSMILPELPVKLIVVSKEKNPIVKARCVKLNLPVVSAVNNKNEYLDRFVKKQKLKWSEVCYIGNDINDIGCLKKAGLSVVPADAHPSVIPHAHYVTNKTGGHGVIREILELMGRVHEINLGL